MLIDYSHVPTSRRNVYDPISKCIQNLLDANYSGSYLIREMHNVIL